MLLLTYTPPHKRTPPLYPQDFLLTKEMITEAIKRFQDAKASRDYFHFSDPIYPIFEPEISKSFDVGRFVAKMKKALDDGNVLIHLETEGRMQRCPDDSIGCSTGNAALRFVPQFVLRPRDPLGLATEPGRMRVIKNRLTSDESVLK